MDNRRLYVTINCSALKISVSFALHIDVNLFRTRFDDVANLFSISISYLLYVLFTGAKKYQCPDGSTMSYLVVGKSDVNLTHTCFVVVNDFFETYETAQVLFRSVVSNEIGTQVLLLNLPGQAYVLFERETRYCLL